MKWISVEERLPENGEWLVNDTEYGVVTSDYLSDDREWRTVRPYGCDSDHEILRNVTHWMPLPDPPVEEKHDNKI